MGRTSDARDRLLAAASELFHASGYNAVGVQEICAAAGVKRGSFYHFFPSKAALAVDALEAQWEDCRGELMEPAFAPDVPPLDRILRLFRMTYENQVSGVDERGQIKGCPFGNLAMELSNQEPAIRRKAEQIFGRMSAYFESAITEYSPAVDSRARADALLAYFQGVILLAKTSRTPEMIDILAKRALELAESPVAVPS